VTTWEMQRRGKETWPAQLKGLGEQWFSTIPPMAEAGKMIILAGHRNRGGIRMKTRANLKTTERKNRLRATHQLAGIKRVRIQDPIA